MPNLSFPLQKTPAFIPRDEWHAPKWWLGYRGTFSLFAFPVFGMSVRMMNISWDGDGSLAREKGIRPVWAGNSQRSRKFPTKQERPIREDGKPVPEGHENMLLAEEEASPR